MDNNQNPNPQTQPGSVITPSSSPTTPVQPTAPPPPSAVPTPIPPTPVEPVAPPPPTPNEVAAQSQIQSSLSPAAAQAAASLQPKSVQATDDGISWVAPEFIQHEQNLGWYLRLIAGAIVVGALIYLLTRDLITSGAIVVVGIILAFYTLRKPKNIQYTLERGSVRIGDKTFPYGAFRSFIAIDEGSKLTSVTFMPMRRFSPPVGMCIFQADEDTILDFLADRLPIENHKPDLVERMMERINF
jgi:hypothetical protein